MLLRKIASWTSPRFCLGFMFRVIKWVDVSSGAVVLGRIF